MNNNDNNIIKIETESIPLALIVTSTIVSICLIVFGILNFYKDIETSLLLFYFGILPSFFALGGWISIIKDLKAKTQIMILIDIEGKSYKFIDENGHISYIPKKSNAELNKIYKITSKRNSYLIEKLNEDNELINKALYDKLKSYIKPEEELIQEKQVKEIEAKIKDGEIKQETDLFLIYNIITAILMVVIFFTNHPMFIFVCFPIPYIMPKIHLTILKKIRKY